MAKVTFHCKQTLTGLDWFPIIDQHNWKMDGQ